MRAGLCVVLAALSAARGGEIVMATFDGAPATTQAWTAVNDPVMGGQSTATFSVDKDESVGVFSGETKIVPSLQAPGFCNMQTRGAGFPDVSVAHALKIVMRSRIQYGGYKVSFGPAPRHGYFASYKADYNVPTSSEFQTVLIPFDRFSSQWSDTTGQPVVTCAANKSVCPDAAHLAHLTDFEFNMEGAAGKFDVEIKSISAVTSDAASVTAGEAGAVIPLVTFDGAAGTTHTWAENNDPVMGGQSVGTTNVSGGRLIFDGEVKIVPSLKAPGFITSRTTDKTPFPDITGCKAISFRCMSTTQYSGYRVLFGNAHPVEGKFFAYGYKSQFVAPVGSFADVVVPIVNFTDYWDDATGNPIKTCKENSRYCPNAKTLKDIATFAFWGEGVEGTVHLEVESVSAVGCAAPTTAAAAAAAPVALVTFDGATGTTHKFSELNDPVMGGKSSGTWTLAQGFGVFDGEVVDVPSLQAPGFIKAMSDVGGFADVSAAVGGDLVLSVRSSTPEYKGFRVSFASGALSPSFSCAGGGALPGSRGCYKAKFSVPAGTGFAEVRIPFRMFSDKWSSATGEQTVTCANDSSVCPTAAKLAKIQDVEIWAEGALGKVHLEIKSVVAVPAAPAPLGGGVDAPAAAGDLDLAFGAASPHNWHSECDPVMGGQSVSGLNQSATAARFSGEVKIVPSLSAPGFCIALTDDVLTAKFPDASAYDGLVFGLTNRGPVTSLKAAFCASRVSFSCQFKSFKADFNASVGDSEVFIPWKQFSNEWSSATGEPTGVSPPKAGDLQSISQLQLWVEGVTGKFDVDIKNVRARRSAV